MKTKVELVREWIKKHDMCGSKAWWDGETYYNLRAEQIVQIAKFLNRKEKENMPLTNQLQFTFIGHADPLFEIEKEVQG